MSERVHLTPVDSVEVTVVIDNAIDILAAQTETAFRPAWQWDWSDGDQLRAEHGYSLSLTVHRNGTSDKILYDAGLSRDATIHNLDVLGLDPKEYPALVLSHGHTDLRRTRRLVWAGSRVDAVRYPPSCLAGTENRVSDRGGDTYAAPSHNDLDREGWHVVEERGPSMLLGDSVLVTGQIDRVTDFEKGFPLQHVETEDGWEPDTWIWDDQAIAIEVRGKGLVVLSSGSHSGVINVLHHVRRVTGVGHILGFIGGLHLTGGLFESIIPNTIQELSALSPDLIVPGHCTGWRATHNVERALPNAYAASNVGTTFAFHADQRSDPEPISTLAPD